MSAPLLTLGVLGGLGPAATLDFLAKVQAFTPAKREADHIRVLVDLNPQVPDLETPGSGAGDVLAEMAGALRGAGADILAMPCNSAHVHAGLIERASGLPLIDMIQTGANAASDLGARRVGVLGVKPAIRLYREYLAAQAMGMVGLDPVRQGDFMATLAAIKAGDLSRERSEQMACFATELVELGAEAVIAGCTEIPLVLDPDAVRADLIDPGELLARRCVAICLGLEAAPTLAD